LAPRANWKGFLKIAEVACPVALYSAVSTAERVAFHTINRVTGHGVRREFFDSATGDVVEKDEQVKGYEVGQGDYVMLEPEEVAAVLPENPKTLSVSAFVACAGVDDVYLDRPYFLAPADKAAEESFILIREGLRQKNMTAVATAVLFRRVRTILIRAYDRGMLATTLNFDYEVRSAQDAFADVPSITIGGEMLDLAKHIITMKKGAFDPSKFEDRYEKALADLVKAKLEGRKIAIPKEPKRETVVDLMASLRESAGLGKKSAEPRAGRKAKPKTAAQRRKAS
jgi:DNA end-binding protein Ku